MLARKPHNQRTDQMASAGKRKTTFAKRAREDKLRERRQAKAAKRAARKLASSETEPSETEPMELGEAPTDENRD
jgi:hypothetical protein